MAGAAIPSVPLLFSSSLLSAGLGALAFATCPLRAYSAAPAPPRLRRRRGVRLGRALRWVLSRIVPGRCRGLAAVRRLANSSLVSWIRGCGVGSVVLGARGPAVWVGVVVGGPWFVSRGGSVEAARVARGVGEGVGGAGEWGCGGVVGRLVGTAGAARRGKSSRVGWSQADD